MPDALSGSLVLDLKIWWRHVHTLYLRYTHLLASYRAELQLQLVVCTMDPDCVGLFFWISEGNEILLGNSRNWIFDTVVGVEIARKKVRAL